MNLKKPFMSFLAKKLNQLFLKIIVGFFGFDRHDGILALPRMLPGEQDD
jgi:hypothetical protein